MNNAIQSLPATRTLSHTTLRQVVAGRRPQGELGETAERFIENICRPVEGVTSKDISELRMRSQPRGNAIVRSS